MSKSVAYWVLVCMGGVLAGTMLLDVYVDWVRKGEPLWAPLLENAVPIGLALSLVHVARTVYQQDGEAVRLAEMARWALLGCVGMILLSGPIIWLHAFPRPIHLGFVPVQLGSIGAIAGLWVGHTIAGFRQARRSIKNDRDRLKRLFDGLPSPVVHGAYEEGELTVLSVNPAFEKHFGYSAEKIEGQDLYEFVVPEGNREDAAEIGRHALQQGGVDREVRRLTAEGPREFYLRVARALNHDSAETYAVYTDITERRKREEELRRKERRYQAVFEDPNFLVGLYDTDGRILNINQPALEYIDSSLDEIVGKLIWDAPWFEGNEEAQHQIRESVHRSSNGEYVEFEFDLSQATGPPLMVDGIVRPVPDEEGEVTSLLISGRDITEQKRQEKELRQQKSLLEQTQRLAGAWEVDLRTEKVNWSETVYEIHEVPPGTEIEVEEAIEFFAPEARPMIRETFDRCVEEKEPYDLEFPVITADGNHRWVRMVGAPSEEEDGEVIKVAGAFQDISERKEKERLRERQNDLFSKAQDLASVGAWEYDILSNKAVWTEEVYQIHGLAPDVEASPEFSMQFYHEEDRPVIEEAFAQAVEDGESYDLELRLITAEGDERWVRTRGEPQTEDGDVVRVRGTIQDITERKRREQTLRRQRNLLDQAQRLAGAWEVDLQTDETSWSDKVYEIYEVEPGTEVGVEEAIEFYAPEVRPKIREAFERCSEAGEPYDLELPIITAEGNRRWVRTVGAPVEEKDGEIIKVAGAFQDITDQKWAEARLRLQTHILQQVAEGASLQGILADLVEGIEELRPGMIGSILLYDSEERRVRHGAAPNLPDAYNEVVGIRVTGPCGAAMHTRSTVVAEDLAEDSRWEEYSELVLSHGLRACWSTPILTSKDEVLGSFAMLYREPQRPSGADEELVELAQSLARIAIERHRNQQALRRERDRFATLFHNLPTPVVHGRAGEDGAIFVRSVNDAFERVFGVEVSAIEGRDIDEYLVPEDRREEAAEINRRVLEEEGYQAEVQRQTPDGTRDFLLQVASRVAEDGSSDVYGIYTDVTEERRRHRRQQRQQEALLELTNDEKVVAGEFDAAIQRITERAAEVLDVARVNVWLFEEEGRLRCKDHYEQSSGVHDSDMELAPGEYPSYVEALAEHRVIEVSDAGSDPRTSGLEEDYLQPHGIGALLDATLRSEGEIIGVVCHEHVGGPREWATDEVQFAGEVADIVHRALRNRDLREHERQLEQIRKNVTNVIWMSTPDKSAMEFISDAYEEIWGRSAEALKEDPTNFVEGIHPEDRKRVRSAVEVQREEPEAYEETYRVVQPSGDVRWIHDKASSVYDDSGRLQRVVGVATDITERKQKEAELKVAKEEAEEASRLKSAMLANMSHEIRTPLTSITGFSEVLKDELEGQPAEFVRQIHKSGQRLMKTLDSVLQLAKLEAGVYEMDREEVSLRDVIDETTEMLRPTAERKSIVLKADLPEAPIEGTWNDGALNRIAGNLVENAIKFTPEGGRITVRGWAEEETAVLEVEDTGVGIGEEALPDIFEAFKQESEGLAREYEGSGLGLSIVKELTEALGGKITVETEKGEGTCFTVRLPQAGDVERTSEEA